MIFDIFSEKTLFSKSYPLNNNSIAEVCQNLADNVGWKKRPVKEKSSLTLSVKTLLRRWINAFGEDEVFTIRCTSRLGNRQLFLELDGKGFDPVENVPVGEDGAQTEDDTSYSTFVFENFCFVPHYQYKAGRNEVCFFLPAQPISDERKLLIAVVAAVVIGGILRIAPGTAVSNFVQAALNPLNEKILAVIKMLAMMMIFLSIASSIGSMGSMKRLGKYGIATLNGIMGVNIATAILVAVTLPFFFPIIQGGAELDFSMLSQIYELLLDIIPSNIFSPFIDGNALQIMFMGVAVGLLLLMLGEAVWLLKKFIYQANLLILQALRVVVLLIPLVIFISILNLILTSDATELAHSTMLFVVLIAYSMLMVVGIRMYTKVKYHINFIENCKNTFSVWLTGLLTASSLACLDANRKICQEKYQVDDEVCSFVIPFQQAFLKVNSMLDFMIVPLILMYAKGMYCPLSNYILYCITAFFLAISAPPVTGGGIAIATILFGKLGLSEHALNIYIALNIFIDMIVTSTQVCILSNVIVVIDRNIKKKKDR